MEKTSPLIIKGIENSSRAFIGPKIVQIDLTGRCNNNCIGCWVHSLYIKNPPRDKNVTLPFNKVKALIDNLSSLATEEIYISGAGEPFLYPEIFEVLELIKRKNMKVNIITNFSLIDKDKAKKIIDLGIDFITASIWAGTPESYIKTHPDKKKEDFYRIKENLRFISDLKKANDLFFPKIKIYNVICNLNHNEINRMIDFSLDTEVEFIEFQIMDIVNQETSFLALSDDDVKETKEQFSSLFNRNDLHFKELKFCNFKSFRDKELYEFPGRFFRATPEFSMKECIQTDKNGQSCALHTLVCPKGSENTPTKINPLIEEELNKVTFKLPKENCSTCHLFGNSCPIDTEGKISLKYLKILGWGSFMRRINVANVYEYTYEKEIIDNLPCYAGWTYSRILSTGEVIPCCKASGKPLGNIHKKSFLKIWNSNNYQEFRYKAKSSPKSNSYFKEINCYKSCDNIGMNLQTHQQILDREAIKRPDRYAFYLPAQKKIIFASLDLPEVKERIIFSATNFKTGNLNHENQFGEGLVIDGGLGFGFAEYEIDFKERGKYELWARYTSGESRPVEIYFDKNMVSNEGLDGITGGWTPEYLKWFREACLDVSKGRHILRIFTRGFIPHIHSFAFLRDIEENQKDELCVSENILSQPSSLRLLKDKVKTTWFISTISKLLDYLRSGRFLTYLKSERFLHNYLDILGIYNGEYAFCSPFHVQIDLTYNCNNNCIGCWCNSPLLEEKALSPEDKRQALPFGLIKEFLDELSQMGTKEIYFSGGGEPFIHPHIMEILEYAKHKNFICYVNTNFTLLNKERIKRLIDLGVDHLTVSIWAATSKIYALTHPNKNEDTFKQIVENLEFLNSTKRETPYIKLYNVIFNLNYQELKGMIGLAKETGSESVEFTLIDTVPGKTEKLLLNPQQIGILQRSTQEVTQCLDSNGCFDGVLLFRFDSFKRRVSSSSDLAKATYDRNIISKLPCYIGWCFSRIMPNGDVNACLKAHRIPTGNLYQMSFKEIWNGDRQKYFRKKTLVCEKKDPFFKLIGNDPDIKEAGCYKSCDDIGRNIYIHNRIMSLTPFERGLLKIMAKVKQKHRLDLASQGKFENPIIKGILNGRKAFVGPGQVVIDITNRCNERCIGCWLYSPLLKENPKPGWLNQEISFKKAKAIISALSDLGTKRIRFTGGGEPFIYPNIIELIEYTKAKGLICCITTNFSLLNKKKVKDLIKLEVDELAISLWASHKETYQKTHPSALPDTFEKIKENLMFLTNEKKNKPFITLCNVICNLNYLEVEEMFKFALEMKADGIYFTLVDILEGTDCLLLDKSQRQVVLKQIETIQKTWQIFPKEKRIKLDYLNGFISRLQEEGSLAGNYDQRRVNEIPCYVGWIFARILADGSVSPCCRGVKKIMGNINRQDFKDIWFSQKYNEFRSKAKYLSKTDHYFSEVGCLKMCDNLMNNEEIHLRI